MLLGQKFGPGRERTLPKGIDQRSASRHPDWTGRTISRSILGCASSRLGKAVYVKVDGGAYCDTALP
jgi:hypothetical protein